MFMCIYYVSVDLRKVFSFPVSMCLLMLSLYSEFSYCSLQIQSCRLKHVESLWLLLSYMRSRMQANNGQVRLIFCLLVLLCDSQAMRELIYSQVGSAFLPISTMKLPSLRPWSLIIIIINFIKS